MKNYSLFAISIDWDTLPEDLMPDNVTLEQAKEFGELIAISDEPKTVLISLITALNTEQYTDQNWFVVFENEKLISC
jgi:hypothetical protein